MRNVEFRIDNSIDRNHVVNALAHAGYKVVVRTEQMPGSYRVKYWIVVECEELEA